MPVDRTRLRLVYIRWRSSTYVTVIASADTTWICVEGALRMSVEVILRVCLRCGLLLVAAYIHTCLVAGELCRDGPPLYAERDSVMWSISSSEPIPHPSSGAFLDTHRREERGNFSLWGPWTANRP